MRIPFTKVVGTGNDFLIVDTIEHRLPTLRSQWPLVARTLCDRHTGIGADGVLVLEPSRRADVRMRVFNPDGSEAEMCGNGARCVALYERQRQATRDKRQKKPESVTIETKAGLLSATVRGEEVAMRMTDPTALRLGLTLGAGRRRVRLGFVNTGVPHAVVPVAAINRVNVPQVGRQLRHHRVFAPRGTNVNFIQADPRHPNRLRVRTYERGVEEETLACGTGIAAAAVIYGLTKGHRSGNGSGRYHIKVQPKSGDQLVVSFTAAAGRVTDVVLTGVARRVFDGVVEWPTRRR